MEIINYFIAFIIGVFFVLIVFFIDAIIKDKKPINKVHFYVARDMNNKLWLYIGKPTRIGTEFNSFEDKKVTVLSSNLKRFGLNEDDYTNLKWENDPIEVFLNLKD